MFKFYVKKYNIGYEIRAKSDSSGHWFPNTFAEALQVLHDLDFRFDKETKEWFLFIDGKPIYTPDKRKLISEFEQHLDYDGKAIEEFYAYNYEEWFLIWLYLREKFGKPVDVNEDYWKKPAREFRNHQNTIETLANSEYTQ